MDETTIYTRKYNVGRAVKQVFVVGGIERGASTRDMDCFIEVVPNRPAATLEAVILARVEKRRK